MNETVVSRMYVTLALHVVLTTQEFVSVALTSAHLVAGIATYD